MLFGWMLSMRIRQDDDDQLIVKNYRKKVIPYGLIDH